MYLYTYVYFRKVNCLQPYFLFQLLHIGFYFWTCLMAGECQHFPETTSTIGLIPDLDYNGKCNVCYLLLVDVRDGRCAGLN